MIARLSPLLKRRPSNPPEYLDLSKAQILKWWDMWLLWRMTGRRVEAFYLAAGWTGPLPNAMLNTLFFLDGFFGIMEEKKSKEEAEEEARNLKRR